MDETESGASEESARQGAGDAAAKAAREAASSLAAGANKALDEIKDMGPGSFFSFDPDRPWFPRMAGYVFTVICILAALVVLVRLWYGFAAIFTIGLFAGLWMVVRAVLGGAIFVAATRFLFEHVQNGFKIRERLDEIAGKRGS